MHPVLVIVALVGAYLGSVLSAAYDVPSVIRAAPPLSLPRQLAAAIGRATVGSLFLVAVLSWT